MMNEDTNIVTIHPKWFYGNYYGHVIEHLYDILNGLRTVNPMKRYVYLAGDSSLDNKHWLPPAMTHDAVNGYDFILKPARMMPDVCYHLNRLLESTEYCVINCAVEESTIGERQKSLFKQDIFIHNNIQNDDILIVSVGGNDIALHPSFSTIWNMVVLMYMNSIESITAGPDQAWGMNHFIRMFKRDVKRYILKMIGDKRPKKIIVCTIYFPDEKMTGSWADRTLGYLGYNDDPRKLQEAIRQIFKHATSQIKIPGSEVVGFPMFSVLNGKDTNDYIQRVEPSSQGGRKLAEEFVKIIEN